MEARYKRRNYFIKKDFQGRIILTSFLCVTGGALVFMVLMAFFSADTLTISYVNNDLQLGQTPSMLMKQTLKANWMLITIGGTALVIVSMLLSHRIAGPLYRLEKALDSMLDGRLDSEIHLRQKDEGKELAEKINTFTGRLSKNLKTVQRSSTAIDALLEQIQTFDLDDEQQEILAGLCWSMQEHNRKIKDACSTYHLKDA